MSPGTATKVWVQLRRFSDGKYWDPVGSWSAPVVNIKSENGEVNVYTSSWTITSGLPSGVNLPGGTSYYMTSSGFDDAAVGGNQEAFYSVRGSTFTYDNVKPTATINAPSLVSTNSLAFIYGTSNDDFTVKRVEMRSGTLLTRHLLELRRVGLSLAASSYGDVRHAP